MDGHVEVARLLLDHGAQVWQKRSNGRPHTYECIFPHVLSLSLSLSLQVNMPNDSFESPLTLAGCGGHYELATLLLDRGADLEEVNDEG